MSNTVTAPVPTPELNRMHAVHDKSQAIGEFLEWLTGERGLVLAEWREGRAVPRPARAQTQELIAEYFEIDLTKVERERRAILKSLRGGSADV